MKHILLIGLFVLPGFLAMAQSTKHAERGDKFYEKFDYNRAIFFYELAHEKDPKDSHTTRQLGLSYRALGNLKSSAQWFEKTLFLDKSKATDMLYLAEALKSHGRYSQALEWYEKYAEQVPGDSRAQRHLSDPEYYKKLNDKGEGVRVRSLGINDDQPSFGIASFDNEYIFSSPGIPGFGVQEKSTWNELPYLDLYVGERGVSNELVNIRPIDGSINTRFHDGPATYDKSSQTIFVTRNNMENGKPVRDNTGTVNLKIYEAQKIEGEWNDVRELTFNSDEYSNAHPCVSFDGQTLYFISNKPGGIGGTDLYRSNRTEDGWSVPENLGSTINTEGNEMFPSLSPDGTLYFASDGHAGLGGLDVFKSQELNEGWTEPINLGAPYNTNNDDFGIIYNKDGSTGYFSSNRDGGVGNDDLFWFEDKSKAVQLLSGTVRGLSQSPGQAYIKAYDPATGSQQMIPLNENGSFAFEAEAGTTYELSYRDQGGEKKWMDYTVPEKISDQNAELGTFDAYEVALAENNSSLNNDTTENTANELSNQSNSASESQNKNKDDKELENIADKNEKEGVIEVNSPDEVDYETSDMLEDLELNNVYFDYNSSNIRPDAKKTLTKLIDLMQSKPQYRIEISAHTDPRGSVEFNRILSRRRAEAAKDYLIAQGISENRIVMNWFGESKQVVDCPDPEDCEEYIYQMNRRAEFKIITE